MAELYWTKEGIRELVAARFPEFTEEIAAVIRATVAETGGADTSDEVIDRVWKIARSRSAGFGIGDLTEAEREAEVEADNPMKDETGGLTPFGRERLRSYLDQALSYEAELEEMSFVDLARLKSTHGEHLSHKGKKRLASLEERDQELFFNGPAAVANFEDVGGILYWTLDEAVAYSFGKDPKVVNSTTLKNKVPGSPFIAAYFKRLKMVESAMELRDLSNPIRPEEFLVWANKRGMKVPDELFWLFQIESPSELRKKCDAANNENKSLRKQVAELQRELDGYRKDFTKENAKSMTSVRKLVLGMAITRFEYITEGNSGAAKAIVGELDEIAIKIDRGTVLEWLKDAAGMLDFEWKKEKQIKGTWTRRRPKSEI